MNRLVSLFCAVLCLALSALFTSSKATAQFQSEFVVAEQLINDPLMTFPRLINDDELMDLLHLRKDKVQWLQKLNDGTYKFNDILSIAGGQTAFNYMMLDDFIGDETDDILVVIQLDDMTGSVRTIQNIAGEFVPGPLSGNFPMDDAVFELMDMDADGDSDLIIAQKGTGELQWVKNLGDGIFADTEVSITTADNLLAIGVGDIDTDDVADLVVLAGEIDDISNEGSNVVVWYKNLGESLAAAAAVETDAGFFTSMYCGPVDDDVRPDIILGSPDLETSLFIIWNDGGGTFSTLLKQLLPGGPGTGAKFITLCQVDGFLSPDILITSDEGSRTAWIKNYGDRTLAPEVQVQQEGEVGDFMSCADLDGNGQGDLIRLHADTDAFNIYYSNELGEYDINLPIASESDAPVSTLVTDGNGDDMLDLVVISKNDWRVQTYLQVAPMIFGAPVIHDTTLPFPEGGALVDMNMDGFEDILLWSASEDLLGWLINLGNNQYLNFQTSDFVAGSFLDMTTGFFNGDGRTDLAIISNSNEIKSYVFFGNDYSLTTIDHEIEMAEALGSGFFGGEGMTDLICYDSELEQMTFLLSDGTGDFTQDFSIPVPVSVEEPQIITGQFDQDGINDIILFGSDGLFVTFLSQNSWAAPEVQNLPCAAIENLTASDYNLDGDDDLCFSCFEAELGITIGYNDGAGSFSYATLFETWTAEHAELVDLDNDTDPDLLWFNSTTDQVSVSENHTLEYTSLLDLNQDGFEDIADLLVLLADMGCQGECVGDINGDTLVNIMDLILFLSQFQ